MEVTEEIKQLFAETEKLKIELRKEQNKLYYVGKADVEWELSKRIYKNMESIYNKLLPIFS